MIALTTIIQCVNVMEEKQLKITAIFVAKSHAVIMLPSSHATVCGDLLPVGRGFSVISHSNVFPPIGNRATSRGDEHVYLRPNPFMGHISSSNLQLLKDGRMTPTVPLDLSGVVNGGDHSGAVIRPAGLSEVFHGGENLSSHSNSLKLLS